MSKKIILVGFGPSNLFAALSLISCDIFLDDILVVDQGPDPEARKEDNLLYGFGGAGFWSDGKYVFSNYPDIVQPYPKDKTKYHDFILGILKTFHPSPEYIKEFPINKEANFGLPLRQSHIVHIGSDNNKGLGIAIYNYLSQYGVKFKFNTKVVHFDLENNFLVTETGEKLDYDYLQIGLGKAGANTVKKLSTLYNFNLLPNKLHIGGRFETILTPKIEEIAAIQHDFKFVKQYGPIEMRTFCANNKRAYVVQEYVDGRVQYNGHGYSEQTPQMTNNLSNFGVLASFYVDNLELEQQKYLDLAKNSVYFGNNYHFFSSLKLTGENIPLDKSIPKVLCGKNPFPTPLRETFNTFVDELNKILELDNNYMIWFPEVKVSLGVLDVKEDFTLKSGQFPNVTWVGDSCVGTRGIVPSAVSGLIATEKFTL